MIIISAIIISINNHQPTVLTPYVTSAGCPRAAGVRAAGEIKFVKFEKCSDFYVDLIQGDFSIGVPLFSTKMKKG